MRRKSWNMLFANDFSKLLCTVGSEPDGLPRSNKLFDRKFEKYNWEKKGRVMSDKVLNFNLFLNQLE